MIETLILKISDEIKAWIKRQKNIIGHITKTSGALILALTFANPKGAWHILYSILAWKNFFIAYFAGFLFFIYFLYPKLKKEWQEEKSEILFFGISLDRVIDYIIKYGTFKRDEIERELSVSRSTYYDMVKRMDEAGIFVRGENNQRILDIRLTKQDIITMLSPETEDEEKPSNSRELNTGAVQSGFKVSEIIPQT